MGWVKYGIPKVGFEPQVLQFSLFDQALSFLFGAKTLLGDLSRTIQTTFPFCFSVIFVPWFCFASLLTQNL